MAVAVVDAQDVDSAKATEIQIEDVGNEDQSNAKDSSSTNEDETK